MRNRAKSIDTKESYNVFVNLNKKLNSQSPGIIDYIILQKNVYEMNLEMDLRTKCVWNTLMAYPKTSCMAFLLLQSLSPLTFFYNRQSSP